MFGFGDGRAVHMYERECSVQRRFQKIIEETPSRGFAAEVRTAMASAAVALVRRERYRGAGTIEFVVDVDSSAHYFLEMNTRIQVEHSVTEMTTGLDLVALQIRLARGDDLSWLTQELIRALGHSIECRLYAENPAMNFLPSPGRLKRLQLPNGIDGLRVDTGVREGDQITFHYDPMIAKIVSHGRDRNEAIARMLTALGEVQVEGVKTNAAFLGRVHRPSGVPGRRYAYGVHRPAFTRLDEGLDGDGRHEWRILIPSCPSLNGASLSETDLFVALQDGSPGQTDDDNVNKGRNSGRERGRHMIYEKPRYLPGGDRYMLIEFGNEMNLELNFMAQGLAP